MPEALLFVLILVGFVCSIVGSFIWLVERGEREHLRVVHWLFPFISFLVFAICSIWLGAAYQNDIKVEKEIITKATNVNSVQVIAVPDVDNKETLVYNVNSKFERQFNNDQEFKVKFYQSGFYFGVYRCQDPTVEIVE
jgi:cytochrome b subunit of formate dehydrogenase